MLCEILNLPMPGGGEAANEQTVTPLVVGVCQLRAGTPERMLITRPTFPEGGQMTGTSEWPRGLRHRRACFPRHTIEHQETC